MALLFFDGFDHVGNNGTILVLKWSSGTSVNLTTSPVRTGTSAMYFNTSSSGAELISKAFPASGGFVVGFAVNTTSWAGTNDPLQIREGTTVHLAIGSDGAGHLTVKRGATVLATSTTVLAANTWYYIEFKGTIHDTTGTYEVRIDGVSDAALTASGVDTRNVGTTGQWDRIRFASTSSQHCIDDVYVCDTSGAIRTTFLGACKIETLLPQTDAVAAGSNAGLTPSTGTDHGALVDENPPNTSDYNSSPTVGLKDTYNYPSLSLTGAILGIQTNLYVAKSDAVARTVCAVVRAGGVDYDGANVSPLTTFAYFSEVRAQNPNTAADWTSADLTTVQAGMKVTV